MTRDKYTEYERPKIIGSNSKGIREAAAARKINNEIQRSLREKRKQWQILPPDNMTLVLRKDVGAFSSGLVLSVPHEIGRVLLHRRLAAILEHDLVSVDAIIEGELEDGVEALGLRAA